MGGWRRKLLLLASLLLLACSHLVHGHALCLDGSAPAPYSNGTAYFCIGRQTATWDMSEGSCCDADQDAQIKGNYLVLSLSSAPDVAACRPMVARFLCQPCNPFEGHLWSRAKAPLICSDFYDAFLSACGAAVVKNIKPFNVDLYKSLYCSPFDTARYYSAAPPTPNLRPAFSSMAGRLPPGIVDAVPVPNSSLWWAVSKGGKIMEFDGAAAPSAAAAVTVLDISGAVFFQTTGETGLLGLAFSPAFATDRRFYVNYVGYSATATTSPGPGIGTRISRFTFAAPPGWPAMGPVAATAAPAVASATAASERVVLAYDQPYQNHNAGWLGFGPEDGFLYIATGDGGSGFDPQNNAQNLGVLLGKMLRINVNVSDATRLPYRVPASNPFAGSPVWAYGLRNPWRCSFDAKFRLWCGDVGQDVAEEVNVVTKGGNFGWKNWEGVGLVKVGQAPPPALLPKYAYCHSAEQAVTNDGCDTTVLGASVVGGAVYRGVKYRNWLAGRYIFADHESYALAALKYNSTAKKWAPQVLLDNIGLRPVTIVEGPAPAYELFVVEYASAEPAMVYEFRCGPVCGEAAML